MLQQMTASGIDPHTHPDVIRILVADASPEARATMTKALALCDDGTTVHEAEDGPSALAALQRQQFDLVFVDRRLPRFDGRAFMEWRAAHGRDSIFILVSDQLMPRWPEIAVQIKAYEVMLKPFNHSHVEKLLQACRRLRMPMRALIVDPQRTSREMTRKILDQSRFTIKADETDTSQYALKMAKLERYDIALIELNLADTGGLETAYQLARVTSSLKTVLTSADSQMGSAQWREKFGVAGFLRKPFRPADLDSLMHEIFGLWRPYLINALL